VTTVPTAGIGRTAAFRHARLVAILMGRDEKHVEAFAREIGENASGHRCQVRLGLLLKDAGVDEIRRKTTVDRIERVLAVNHRGRYFIAATIGIAAA
jgi:hypothetical protein